ncbi:MULTISPECIES: lactoylglutathione lyase [Halomonas]|uniref:lactoylglutathione lyase n=2 Tax=Halomonas TaxID=2745 RepID=A0AAU7KE67_9GAMM|nr:MULTISPECIES: lactoylglutathione lyase [Halomonas]MBR9770461.1 lactoylglutathione lyase [Gammaproteobacteria bacterium]KJZ04794.1 lactoylglutathione lyase [Halomonas sp. S2151]MAR71132.1 lactoylglutathione lyase [Halomonas sp.]MBR9880852.1 lactoylglutathione lyase [Gammaproteobacteria bacterium]MBS8269057.1 lactoylglutathione lyase [Halomonas litopenaei]|tara:strand:- start:2124 stop:2666 length:543 start_codon:yes stop_codon:yes gene_type:complete
MHDNFQGEQHPGVEPAPEATRGFRLNHSMLRVKDPEVSLAFYSRVFGMSVLRRLDFEEMQFSLYFLANLEADDQVPEDAAARSTWTFQQRGLLEFTHNWGSEEQEGRIYHDGNAEPQGFGHICFAVPDLHAAVAWFDENDVEFIKRPEQGKLKDVVFVKDPDGYWIEVVQPSLMANMGDA